MTDEDREALDEVLAFISEASLTDEEFDDLELESSSDDLLNYGALSEVLASRESVSSSQDRLEHYYLAMGVEVSPAATGSSNILVGGGLCD